MLFLKGGAIVPTGPVVQHVGEASPTDTVTLLIALDETGKIIMVCLHFLCFGFACILTWFCTTFLTFCALLLSGKAAGDLYEDDGDGFGYQNGNYLLTHYEAEKISTPSAKDGEVVICIASTAGRRERPKRTLHVRLLIGEDVEVSEKATSDFTKWIIVADFDT